MTVHFICIGNAHRSIIAEAYLKSLKLPGINVVSSGTKADIFRHDNEPFIPIMISRLTKYGISEYCKTRPEQLTQSRVDRGDITICMNYIVVDECKKIVKMPDKTIIWNVMDSNEGDHVILPGEDIFKYLDETYEKIKTNIDNLVREPTFN